MVQKDLLYDIVNHTLALQRSVTYSLSANFDYFMEVFISQTDTKDIFIQACICEFVFSQGVFFTMRFTLLLV